MKKITPFIPLFLCILTLQGCATIYVNEFSKDREYEDEVENISTAYLDKNQDILLCGQGHLASSSETEKFIIIVPSKAIAIKSKFTETPIINIERSNIIKNHPSPNEVKKNSLVRLAVDQKIYPITDHNKGTNNFIVNTNKATSIEYFYTLDESIFKEHNTLTLKIEPKTRQGLPILKILYPLSITYDVVTSPLQFLCCFICPGNPCGMSI